ncbi:uncharacterized protein LOC144994103 isoform X2 [Oryzias latipes]
MRGFLLGPWILLTLAWTLRAEVTDTDVTCLVMETCILPCSVPREGSITVRWFKDPEIVPFLTYGITNPDRGNVNNRTSLFEDQIFEGNASILLSKVQLQDQGSYRCVVVSSRNGHTRNVKVMVQAPVTDGHAKEGFDRDPSLARPTPPPPPGWSNGGGAAGEEGSSRDPSLASPTPPPRTHTMTTPQQSTQTVHAISDSRVRPTEVVDVDPNETQATGKGDDKASREVEGERGFPFFIYFNFFFFKFVCFFLLLVSAASPVTKVRLEQVDNTVVCISEGIYPEPELTWSTQPPSGRTLNATTAVRRTSRMLYDIRSTVELSPEDAGLVYSCAVASGINSKKATVKIQFCRLRNRVLFVLIPIGLAALAICAIVWRMRRKMKRGLAPASINLSDLLHKT